MQGKLILHAVSVAVLIGCSRAPDEPSLPPIGILPIAEQPTGASPSRATTVQPDAAAGQDVWITSVYSYGDDYGVDDEKLQVGGWGDLYHTLLRFDITGLPKNAGSATIVLQPFARTEFAASDLSTTVPMTLHQVTSAWDENTGWFSRPAASFLASLPAPTAGVPYAIDVTSLYNSWQAGTSLNFGIELRPTANNNRFNVFRSSDYRADPSLRPKLVVVPGTTRSADHFTWPIDPNNSSNGFYASCYDNPQCFWLNKPGWRDVQPFLRYLLVGSDGHFYGYHLGADWNFGVEPGDAGLPVYAAADGVVLPVQSDVPGWGNVIFVRHTTSFGIYTSMYAHVNWGPAGPPRAGPVFKGQQLAVIGNGDGIYPYHLHFEIRAGTSTEVGHGYVPTPTTDPPNGQVDPDAFIAAHR